MKIIQSSHRSDELLPKKTLQHLVSNVAANLLTNAAEKKSFIVNDITDDLVIGTDENMLTDVLTGLLNTAVSNAENSCIRVAARVYGSIVLIHVRDTRKSDNQVMTALLDKMQPLAEKIGGCVTLSNEREKVITVSFSFLNLPKAA